MVTTDAGDTDAVREQVEQAGRGEEVEIHVVVPATKVSRLQWLANDEDKARRQAADEAETTAAALPGEAGTEVGDSDPVLAIEDALRTFPADELVVATRAGGAADWLEQGSGEEALRRFRLPVRRVVLEDD